MSNNSTTARLLRGKNKSTVLSTDDKRIIVMTKNPDLLAEAKCIYKELMGALTEMKRFDKSRPAAEADLRQAATERLLIALNVQKAFNARLDRIAMTLIITKGD